MHARQVEAHRLRSLDVSSQRSVVRCRVDAVRPVRLVEDATQASRRAVQDDMAVFDGDRAERDVALDPVAALGRQGNGMEVRVLRAPLARVVDAQDGLVTEVREEPSDLQVDVDG